MNSRKAHGPAIRGIREAMGMQLPTLAAKSGVSIPHLSRIERGQRSPSVAVVRAIANALNVTIDQITYPVADEQVAS